MYEATWLDDQCWGAAKRYPDVKSDLTTLLIPMDPIFSALFDIAHATHYEVEEKVTMDINVSIPVVLFVSIFHVLAILVMIRLFAWYMLRGIMNLCFSSNLHPTM